MAKLIVGNWKMNGTAALASALVPEIAQFAASRRSDDEIVICPPFTLLAEVARQVQGSFISVGAQDVSAHKDGSFTGDISADMLKEAGCRYVIVGHSERRSLHAETSGQVRAKADAALAAGLIPIICMGETLEQRESGSALSVVEAQVKASIPTASGDFVLAYEPVWAIGSGRNAHSTDIEDMHRHILSLLPEARILYGGSVKAANAGEILSIEGVSGVLVGGASLKAEEFCGIIAAS